MANSQLAPFGFGRDHFRDPFFGSSDPFDDMMSMMTPFGFGGGMDRMMGQMMQSMMSSMGGAGMEDMFARSGAAGGGAMYMQQAVITSDGRNTVYERKERMRDMAGNDHSALERGTNDRAKLKVRHKSAGTNDFREEVHYRNVPEAEEETFDDQWASSARSVLQHNRDRMASLADGDYQWRPARNNNNGNNAIANGNGNSDTYHHDRRGSRDRPLAIEDGSSRTNGGSGVKEEEEDRRRHRRHRAKSASSSPSAILSPSSSRNRHHSTADDVIDVEVQQVRHGRAVPEPERRYSPEREYSSERYTGLNEDRPSSSSRPYRYSSSYKPASSSSSPPPPPPAPTMTKPPSSSSSSRRKAQSNPEKPVRESSFGTPRRKY